MLKKLAFSAMAALMVLATLSITEAASCNDEQNTLCHRGGYCYNQNSNCDDDNNVCYDSGYCGRGRGCW